MTDLQWEDAETPGREGAERSRCQRDGRWYASSIALWAWAGKVVWIVGYGLFGAVIMYLAFGG